MGSKDKRHTLGMTVEKVSLAVLAVLGVYSIATALEVLPIIRRRRNQAAQAVLREHG